MPADNGCMRIAFPHTWEPNQSNKPASVFMVPYKQHLEMKMRMSGTGKHINIGQLTLQALKEVQHSHYRAD